MLRQLWMTLLVVLAACNTGLQPITGADPSLEGLVGVLIVPEDVILPQGSQVQLKATGLYEDRTTADLTSVVTWTSSAENVAEVSNDFDAEGVAIGRGVGSSEVRAHVGGIESPAAYVKVTEEALDGLSVEPGEVTVGKGDTVQLTAHARFSDSSTSDASAQVRWVTQDGGVATLDNGLLTATGVGTTLVYAQWDDVRSNQVTVNVGQGGGNPDLYISNFASWATGDIVELSVTIRNDGDAGASDFWLDVFLDPSGTPGVGDVGDDYVRVPYVGPGQTAQFSFQFYDVSSGSHSVAAFVDIEDEISESDEGNNRGTGSVNVGGGGGSLGPNLVVDYFGYLADSYSIYYIVDVSNYGDTAADSFYVELFIDSYYAPQAFEDGDVYESVSYLGAWDTTTVEFLVDEYCYACWSWVSVDSYQTVDEWDETDNVEGPLIVSNDTGWW